MKAYRPSNGTEGMGFYELFCAKCKSPGFGELEQAWQESEVGRAPVPTAHAHGQGCPILCRTLAYDTDDPEYPAEWVIDDDEMSNPRCTAFSDEDPPEPPPFVDPNQLSIF